MKALRSMKKITLDNYMVAGSILCVPDKLQPISICSKLKIIASSGL